MRVYCDYILYVCLWTRFINFRNFVFSLESITQSVAVTYQYCSNYNRKEQTLKFIHWDKRASGYQSGIFTTDSVISLRPKSVSYPIK